MSGMMISPCKWVRLSRYETMSGITPDGMKGKIKNGKVIEGQHWRHAPDGKIMVNWQEMDNWVESCS